MDKVDQSCKRTRPLSENYDSTENIRKKKAVASKGQLCQNNALLKHYYHSVSFQPDNYGKKSVFRVLIDSPCISSYSRQKAGYNNRLFSHSSLCFNSVPSKSRCVNSMRIWLHWVYQYALPAQRDFLVSSFTQTQLSVCVVVMTNIHPKYTPLITT